MRNIYQAVSRIIGDIMGLSPDLVSPAADVSRFRYQEKAAAAIACEKSFHVTLEDERIDDLKTVEQWVDYIAERVAEKKEDRPAPTDQEREAWYYR
jgi:hypothetical protein